jgi:hypothetical protein
MSKTAWGQAFDDNRQLSAELRTAKDENDALKAERDALAAQVEVLKVSLSEAQQTVGFLSHHLRGRMGEVALIDLAEKADHWASVLQAVPAQHLAEIRAEAGRVGFIAGANEFSASASMDDHIELLANLYDEKIRQGGDV